VWGILVADMNGGKWVVLHHFEQNRGARSWRRNDPHPVFSADGKRIYYNTSDGQFTRLMVAERP
jgi:Tol biopolymer transport system component